MAAQGTVVWFTGAPSAGKSTLASKAAEQLRALGIAVAELDGDAVRAALVPSPGYDPAARDAFYSTLSSLAALLARQGLVVLVAATAHLSEYRERARKAAPSFVEVFVDAPEHERRARDAKGLYQAQSGGALSGLPGADLAYEAPTSPDIRAEGGHDTAAIQALIRLLEAKRRIFVAP